MFHQLKHQWKILQNGPVVVSLNQQENVQLSFILFIGKKNPLQSLVLDSNALSLYVYHILLC